MKKAFKWRMTCATDGVVYNYNEDDSNPPGCPCSDQHSVSNETIVDSIIKEIIGTEILTGKTSEKMKLRGAVFTAAKNSSTSHNYDINEDFYIKDGSLVTEGNVMGDTVDIDLCQQDGTVLYQYVKDYPVSKLKDTGFVDQTLSDTNFNGLRLKTTYNSTGLTDDVIVGLQLNGQN